MRRTTQSRRCMTCGEVQGASKFCRSCGAPLSSRSALPVGSRTSLRIVTGRLDFRGLRLAGRAEALSAVTVGVGSAGFGVVATLLVGLLYGVVFELIPATFIFSLGGPLGSTWRDYAASTNFTPFAQGEGVIFRTLPVLLSVVPVAVMTMAQVRLETRYCSDEPRSVLGTLIRSSILALSMGLALGLIASAAGQVLVLHGLKTDSASAWTSFGFGHGFLFGLASGVVSAGIAHKSLVKRGAEESFTSNLAPRLQGWPGVISRSLRPLGGLLIATSVVGTLVVVFQVSNLTVVRIQTDARQRTDDGYTYFNPWEGYSSGDIPQSRGTAGVQALAYAPENGLNFAQLGAGSMFECRVDGVAQPGGLDSGVVIPMTEEGLARLATGACAGGDSTFSILGLFGVFESGLSKLLSGFFMLLVVTALTTAGFLAARGSGSPAMARRSAVGAIVGPVWSVTMVGLSFFVSKYVLAVPVFSSVFLCFLLGGLLFGALGGVMSVLADRRQAGL